MVNAMVVALALAAGAPEGDAHWHRVVGILQYLEGDYPAALASGDAAELTEQRGFADEVVTALAGDARLAEATALRDAIVASAPSDAVTTQARALALELVKAHGLVQAPKQPPSLEAGAALFATNCAACHGEKGDGVSALAETLTPKPANFHDSERMRALTPYQVFNTVTFGISGTPMVGFPQLSDAERWNLAFTVSALRHPPCAGAPPSVTLSALATSTDDALEQKYGAAAVACLRRTMPSLDAQAVFQVARTGVEKARALSSAGRHDEARKALVDAYLEGVEPVEPALRARSPEAVTAIEVAFTEARLATQRGDSLDAPVAAILRALSTAESSGGAGSFWSVFIATILILLREGFEATVVVGALLAVLKKMEATSQVRVVHAAWSSALVAGAVAFIFGQRALAGANREWLETGVALFAVVMLVYAALWLNARANMSAFMGELRAQMKSALGQGSTAGLFVIAFTSVGRETFETALFLQGLAVDSSEGVRWGALAGMVLLVGLVVFVRTVGFRLPMKTLFTASTVVLMATAVALLGKGLHGLQELGVLPLAPFRAPEFAALGLFADIVSLGPQVMLAAVPTAWWWINRRRPSRGNEGAPTP
ncbi:MAG: FTR1 family protein [Archangium sp.]|nr:FTR1 family protein [Archangium sp.]